MKLPQLQEEKRGTNGIYKYTSREMTQTFKGYNNNRRISDGEFRDLSGFCGDEYPVMSTISSGAMAMLSAGGDEGREISRAVAVFSHMDHVGYITETDDGFYLHYRNNTILLPDKRLESEYGQPYYAKAIYLRKESDEASPTLTFSESTFFEDFENYYVNDLFLTYTLDGDWSSSRSAEVLPLSEYGISIAGTPIAGDVIQIKTRRNVPRVVSLGAEICIFPVLGKGNGSVAPVAFNTNTNVLRTLEQFVGPGGSSFTITPIDDAHFSIDHAGIGAAFSKGDAVSLSNFSDAEINTQDGTYVIIEDIPNDDQIVINGHVSASSQSTTGYVQRSVPDMDFVVAHGNRLWGCSFDNHEIYSCKLGDPTNWRVYHGLVSDSYAATCITESPFTGAASVGNYVLFFTESQIIKIYGTQPSNFTVSYVSAPGIKEGSWQSAVNINEVLYYHGADGIYAFSGGLPVKVTTAFAKDEYSEGIAGRIGKKYMLAMRYFKDQTWRVFAYNTENKTLYPEFYTRPMCGFASTVSNMYFLDCSYAGGISFLHAYSQSDSDLDPFQAPWGSFNFTRDNSWSAQTGEIDLALADQKYVSKIVIRAELERNATLNVFTRYDGDTQFQEEASVIGSGRLGSISVPIIPRRCDYMEIKLQGTRGAVIYSISKQIEQGSEL